MQPLLPNTFSVGLYFIYVGCSLLCVVPNLIEPFATRRKYQDIQINFRSQFSIQSSLSSQSSSRSSLSVISQNISDLLDHNKK